MAAVEAPPGIFKAYDVRGLYGEEIDGDLAEAIGRAFVRVLAGLAGKPAAELRVGLGRDMRLNAPELAGRWIFSPPRLWSADNRAFLHWNAQ